MADLISWGPNFITGVNLIDTDHKKLVDMLNGLAKAMTDGKGKSALAPLLNNLVDYTVKHFGNEERLMVQYHYVDAPAHLDEHKKLVADVLAFKADLDSGKAVISIAILHFLREWLSNHIMKTDMKFGKSLIEAGYR